MSRYASAFVRTILRKLTPVFAKKGLALEVELVDTASWPHRTDQSNPFVTIPLCPIEIIDRFVSSEIRNWAKLMPNNATLRNAYRSRKSDGENNCRVPQSFSFFPREGMALMSTNNCAGCKETKCNTLHSSLFLVSMPLPTPLCSLRPAMPHGGVGINTEENLPRRLRAEGNGRDMFALVKQNMADSVLIQPPLLVWQHSLLGSVENFWNRVNVTDEILQQTLDQSRVDELMLLADQILQDFPHMVRTYQYYKTLTDPNRPRKPYQNLDFIDAGPQASSRVGDVRLGERPPPPRPHRLEVTFHHAQR